jgi:drug/metabolite transporter (DMT)-like permease
MTSRTPSRLTLIAALLTVYVVWGSTYGAIRIAIRDIPPLLMCGGRFLLAGTLLLATVRARGAPRLSAQNWRSAGIVGILLCGANGLLSVAEQSVSSSLAAVVIASVPVCVVLFGAFFGTIPSAGEIAGVLVGFAGVAVLQLGGQIDASGTGLLLLVVATLSWAAGSVFSPRLDLPKGLAASAAEMICGGAVVLVIGIASGERLHQVPGAAALGAFGYLVLFGSMLAFSAYSFLLANARPALATSYAYVNPVVAIGIGAWLLHERIGPRVLASLVLILAGVATVALLRKRNHAAVIPLPPVAQREL